MSIRRMVYVACDNCGDPCGGTDQMADDAKDARAYAKRMGWTRVQRYSVSGSPERSDLCPRCKRPEGVSGDRP